MKLKYNFIINEVAGKMVAVAVGGDVENFNGFLKTNKEGAEALELLKNDISYDELVNAMAEKHPETDLEEVKQFVTEFTEELKEAGVLEG